MDMAYQWHQVLEEFRGDGPKILMTEAYSPLNIIVEYYGNDTHNGSQVPFNFEVLTKLNKDSTARDLKVIAENYLNYIPTDFESEMAQKIDQKEYLKKYLSGDVGSEKKKKKKKSKEIKGKTVTVVDDDWDFSKIKHLDDDAEIEAAVLLNEDAPQIVGVIDERPPELKALDYKNKLWKGLNEIDRPSSTKSSKSLSIEVKFKKERHDDLSPKRSRQKSPDLSPQRSRRRKSSDEDLSPKRSRKRSEDLSPQRSRKRRSSNEDLSPRRSRKRSEDLSPQRSRRRKSSDEDLSPKRSRKRSEDLSPQRSRKRRSSDEDLSPKRSRKRSEDLSPQRSRRRKNSDEDLSPKRSRKRSEDVSPQRSRRRKSSDEDLSPPRPRKNRSPNISPQTRRNDENNRESSSKRQRRSRFTDISPERENRTQRNSPYMSPSRARKDLDLSPVRKRRKRTPSLSPTRARKDLDLSPDRNRKSNKYSRSPRRNNQSPGRRRRSPDLSPQRVNRNRRKSTESPPPTHGKMKRTMDGKMAGLQNANNLKVENAAHSKREAEMYEKMSEEMSGRNAQARVRATGAVDRRKLEANLAKEREKEEKYAERKQVYDKWGKGVKQLEDYREHLEIAARDASKPFARYAGDEDVERHLKEQERLEDPMLNYIRSKRKQKEIKEKVPTKPIYKGLFPDNRFNIRPGYRWDGVDRSNGYEKRHFEAINVRKATKEEAYLYSTEDM
uniref:BUD13 homolog n=1 Tax=Culicoides sonorensis TaxID=179676 RepID=A0A336K3E2_CULSO